MTTRRLTTMLFAFTLAVGSFVGARAALAASPWEQIAGCANWITQGVDGQVFALDCSPGEQSVYKYTGSASFPWASQPGFGVQISRYDSSSMWLRRLDGRIQKWNDSTSSWGTPLSFGGGTACASYIAATWNGVYALGCETTGQKSIWFWDGSVWSGLTAPSVSTYGVVTQLYCRAYTQGIYAYDELYMVTASPKSRSLKWDSSGGSPLPGTTNRLATGTGGYGDYFEALGIGDNVIYQWKNPWVGAWISTPNAPTWLFTGSRKNGYEWALNNRGEIFRAHEVQVP